MHRQMGFGAAALACTLAWFAAGCGNPATGSTEATVTAFETHEVTFNECHTVEDDAFAGGARGGIALTPKGALYNGSLSTVSYDKVTLANAPKTFPMRDGLVEDLQTRNVYSLGSSDGTLLSGAGSPNENYQGPWDSLWLLNADLVPSGHRIALSQPISFGPGDVGGQHGVFAGYGHVFFYDGASGPGHYYKVELATGAVSDLPVGFPPIDATTCGSWAFWGWAENFNGKDYLSYAIDFFPIETIILRVDITGTEAPPYAFLGVLPPSDMCSIVPDPEDGRWYFQYQTGSTGVPGYPNAGGTLGYCDATYSYGQSI